MYLSKVFSSEPTVFRLFIQRKGTKQIVVTGEENENNVVIEQGLEAGTVIYLSTPENPEKFKLSGAGSDCREPGACQSKERRGKEGQEEAAKANTRDSGDRKE